MRRRTFGNTRILTFNWESGCGCFVLGEMGLMRGIWESGHGGTQRSAEDHGGELRGVLLHKERTKERICRKPDCQIERE